jgi:alkanesulfonate monooxygenase SsuD/methylene tetrahydromethanopterin reductase-like flavin-dependent oxidoreductase (luciferase family)
MLGGTGPRSLALAARLGDGNLFGTAMPVGDVEASCRIVRATVGEAAHPVVTTVVVATGHGAQERVDRELPHWGRAPGEDAGVAGNADEVAAYLRRLAAVGVTSAVVHPTRDEPDLPGLLRFVGEQVRPLLG